MPDRKWENESDKVKACKMRKEINPDTGNNYTNAEIKAHFYRKGKLFYEVRHNNKEQPPQEQSSQISSQHSPPAATGGSFFSPSDIPEEITDSFVEKVTIMAMMNPTRESIAAAEMGRKWLETKERSNLNSAKENDICRNLKREDTSDLLLFIKPSQDDSLNSLKKNSLPEPSL